VTNSELEGEGDDCEGDCEYDREEDCEGDCVTSAVMGTESL